MKPVISMQQIISPTSHNQSVVGFGSAKPELSNAFAKTFHL
jgi:hypothetical protein